MKGRLKTRLESFDHSSQKSRDRIEGSEEEQELKQEVEN